jgi:Holliday junction resolvase RusA-like endonuclease
MHQIELFGRPISWQAPKRCGNHYFSPNYKEKEQIKWQIRAQYRDEILIGYVDLDFVFFLPIPASTSKVKRRQMLSGFIMPGILDTTDMQKVYEDLLKGIVIENDRYVIDITSKKRYSEKPGVLIRIITHAEKYGRDGDATSP